MHAIQAMLMRGGTSKGLYLLGSDLAAALGEDETRRDAFQLAAMGSPDARQIDGLGGAHPLTSKVAVVGPSPDPRADIDYLFLQVFVDEPRVSSAQTCGNLLAGVGPFAIERGLVAVAGATTDIRVRMVNTGAYATAHVRTIPGGGVVYAGDTAISGVPGTAAPVVIDFEDVAGASCGALLPSGRATDTIAGVEATLVDNGMPVVVLRACDLGLRGDETPVALESNAALTEHIERIRLEAGALMGLGDVAEKSVPKVSLVAPSTIGGSFDTRTFIPFRVHEAIGVLGALSVATAALLPGSVISEYAPPVETDGEPLRIDVGHPTGLMTVEIDIENGQSELVVRRAALLRTARKIMDGMLFVETGGRSQPGEKNGRC